MKRILILLISSILISVSVSGLSLCYADTLLSDEAFEILDNKTPRTVVVQIKPDILMPFSQQRLGMLNELLNHVTFRVCQDDDLESVSLCMDGKDIITITIDTGFSGKTGMEISLLPDTVYISDDPVSLFSNSKALVGNLSDISDSVSIRSIDLFIAMLGNIMDILPENTKSSDIKTKIGKYGTAVKKHVLTISQDQTDSIDKLSEHLSDLCIDTHILPESSRLILSGKQQATDFRDADDNCLRFQYSGKIGLNSEDIRNTSLDWKGMHSSDSKSDDLILKTPAVKGGNRNNIVYKRQIKKINDVETDNINATFDTVINKLRSTGKNDASVTYERTSDGIHISGNITLSNETKGISKYQVKITPDLTLSSEDETYGSIRIERIENKYTVEDVTFLITAEPSAQISWTEPNNQVDIDQLNDAERNDIKNKLINMVAVGLIKPLILLQNNDYISEGINEVSWRNIADSARM